jgi:hypothetical protein
MKEILVNKVEMKLNSMANEKETFLDFIRDTENMLGIEHQEFNCCSLKQLDDYIDFLDDMWNK